MAEKRDPASTIFEEFIERHEADGSIDLEAFCAEHPGLSDELRELHRVLQRLRSAASSARPDGESDAGSGDEVGAALKALERLRARRYGFSRYRLDGEVARGGQGAVLRVWDEDLRRQLAMKVILEPCVRTGSEERADSKTIGRFIDEAQVTGQLDHPGIVPVHELGVDDGGRAYFTMKLVKGVDLRTVIARARNGDDDWSLTRAVGVLLKAAEAMAYAHSKGVIHRDLKPANIMVGRFGEVYVMDWGLARTLGQDDGKDIRIRPPSEATRSIHTDVRDQPSDSPLLTMDGDVVGTPAYMSPEQARGDLAAMGPHSDVYSLGAILYHLLAGHMPYAPPGKRINALAIWSHLQDGPPSPLPTDGPPELRAICEKAMARDVEGRYPSTVDLAADLRAYLEGRVVTAFERGRTAEARKWVRRNRGLTAAMAAAIVVLAVGLAVSLTFWGRSEASRRSSDVNAARASAQERIALESAARAEDASRAARLQSYVASVRAARFALGEGRIEEAQRFLDACPDEHRGWEHGHLALSADAASTVLAAHDGGVLRLAWSPDGSILASIGNDLVVRLWGGEAMDAIGSLRGHRPGSRIEPAPAALEWSHDGAILATAAGDPTIFLWDARSAEPRGTLQGHTASIGALVWHPRDALLASCALDGTIRVWDVDAGAPIFTVETGIERRTQVAWSTDGSLLATVVRPDGARDGHVLAVRDTETWEVLGQRESKSRPMIAWADEGALVWGWHEDVLARDDFAGSSDSTWTLPMERLRSGGWGDLRYSPASGRLALATPDGVAFVDSSDGRVAAEIDVASWPGAATFDPSGTRVAARDQRDVLWIVNEGAATPTVGLRGHVGDVHDVAWSPSGDRVASASEDGTVRVWCPDGGSPSSTLAGHQDDVESTAWSAGGRFLASASDDGAVGVWDAETGALLQSVALDYWKLALAWSPVRDEVAVAADDEIVVIDAVHGLVGSIAVSSTVYELAWGPSGTSVVFQRTDEDRVVERRSVEEGALMESFDHSERVLDFELSPDAERLATLDVAGVVRIWTLGDTGSPTVVEPLEGMNDSAAVDRSILRRQAPGRLAWDSTGSRLAFIWSETVGVFESTVARPVFRFERSSTVYDLEWAPDGRSLALARHGEGVAVLDVDSGSLAATLEGHTREAYSVAWSPDGRRLASRSFDGMVRVWCTDTDQALVDLEWEGGTSALFSGEWQPWNPDGSRVLTATRGGPRIWHGDVESAVPIWRTSADLARAHAAVEDLYRALLRPESVAAAIRNDATIDEDERRIRLRSAALHSTPTVNWLCDEAMDLVGPDRGTTGDVARGLTIAEYALELEPESALVRITLGWALLAHERYDDAREQLRLAATSNDGPVRQHERQRLAEAIAEASE